MNIAVRTEPHFRITTEEAKQFWKNGLYNAATYLHHLFSAMKAQGWKIRIPSVDQFCAEWEINRRTFYKAKAKLTGLGWVEEHAPGGLEITITPNEQKFSDCERSFTPDEQMFLDCEQMGTPNEQVVTTTSEKPNKSSDHSDLPDRSQILINSSTTLSHEPETERDNFVEEEFRAYVTGCLRPTCKGNLTAYVSTALKNNRKEWLERYQAFVERRERNDSLHAQDTNQNNFAVNSMIEVKKNSASAADLQVRRANFVRAWETRPERREQFEQALREQPELGLFVMDGELQQFEEVTL